VHPQAAQGREAEAAAAAADLRERLVAAEGSLCSAAAQRDQLQVQLQRLESNLSSEQNVARQSLAHWQVDIRGCIAQDSMPHSRVCVLARVSRLIDKVRSLA
jgi:hypothetical protein